MGTFVEVKAKAVSPDLVIPDIHERLWYRKFGISTSFCSETRFCLLLKVFALEESILTQLLHFLFLLMCHCDTCLYCFIPVPGYHHSATEIKGKKGFSGHLNINTQRVRLFNDFGSTLQFYVRWQKYNYFLGWISVLLWTWYLSVSSSVLSWLSFLNFLQTKTSISENALQIKFYNISLITAKINHP